MQTKLIHNLLDKGQLNKANDILRSCVHCGFCLSACPTYYLGGDEQNSPRGRIYTIKAMLEGEAFDSSNLDNCLICRSCETTCPSGVRYSQLLDLAKNFNYKNKSVFYKLPRLLLRKTLTTPLIVNLVKKKYVKITQNKYPKNIILLTGCVQKPLAPNINLATTKVLNKLGIGVINTKQKECCGAIDLHNGGHQDGIVRIKQNIDSWIELLKNASCIISTASGCGSTIKDYSNHFDKGDEYYQKSKLIVDKAMDISEFLTTQDLTIFKAKNIQVSYHEPCTLQHGQQLAGITQNILTKIGYNIKTINDNHLCCGSAGTYAIFKPTTAKKLRQAKIENLGVCELILTSNIGCLMHLQKGTKTPVKHWIEILVD